MLFVYVFAVVLIALIAFMTLLLVERKRGVRVLASRRDAFDAWVMQTEQDMRTVKASEFIEHSIRFVAYHVTHIMVSLLHFVVRWFERSLRKLRRRLQRARPKQEEPSSYVKEMHEFKNGLNGDE